jgi:hypothetical protein
MMVVISIIFPCNFGCPNCPYTDGNSDLRKFYHAEGGDPLPQALWNKMADECGPYQSWMRCTGGGEPMLHPRMVEMIEYAKEKGARIWLTRAGSLDPQRGRSCALWQRLLGRPASEPGFYAFYAPLSWPASRSASRGRLLDADRPGPIANGRAKAGLWGQGLQGAMPENTLYVVYALYVLPPFLWSLSRVRSPTAAGDSGERRRLSPWALLCPAVVRAPPLRPAHADPQPLLQTGRGAAESGAAEHRPRSISAVQHFHRVLKPGGCLVFDCVRSDGTGLDTAAALRDRVPTLEFILKHFDIIQGRVTREGAHVETVAARKR